LLSFFAPDGDDELFLKGSGVIEAFIDEFCIFCDFYVMIDEMF